MAAIALKIRHCLGSGGAAGLPGPAAAGGRALRADGSDLLPRKAGGVVSGGVQ